MTARAGTAYIDFEGKFGLLHRQVRQAASQSEGAFKPVGRNIAASLSRGVAGAAREVGRTIETAMQVGAAATAALGGAAIGAGLEYNTLGQRATAAMTTVLGSGEKATAMMRELMQFASESPFPRQAFIDASQRLLAFGFDAKQVIPTLTAIQDSVAAIGGTATDIDALTETLSKVRASGKLTGQDLVEFGNRGVNAAKLIGQNLTETSDGYVLVTDEMRKMGDVATLSGEQVRDIMSQPGGITEAVGDVDTVLTALTQGMEQDFGGAAKNLKGTWIGTTDSMKARVRDLGAAFVQPFVGFRKGGALVEGLNAVNTAVKEFVGTGEDGSARFKGALEPLNGVARRLSRRVRGALEMVAGWIGKIDLRRIGRITDRFKDLGPAVAAIGTAFGARLGGSIPILGQFLGGINPVVGAVGALIASSPDLRSKFGQALTGTFNALKPVLPVILTAFQAVATTVLDKLTPVLPGLAEAFANLVQGLVPLVAAADPLVSIVADLATGFADFLAAVPPPVITGVAIAFGVWTAAQWALNAAMAASPITLIVAGVAALAAGAILVVKHWDKVQAAFKAAWDFIKRYLTAALDWVKGAGRKIAQPFIDGWAKAKGAVLDAKNWTVARVAEIVAFVRRVPGQVAGFFTGLGGKIWGQIKGIGEFFARLGRQWLAASREKVGQIVEFVRGIPGRIWRGIKAAVGFLGRIVRAWDRAMRDTLGKIVQFVAGLPGKFWTGIKRIAGFGQSLASRFMDGLRTLGGTMWTFVSGLPARFWRGIQRIAGYGRDLAEKFMRGLRTLGDKAFQFAKSIPGRVWDGIKGIGRIGRDAGKSLANGLIELFNRGIRAINRVTPGKIKMPGPVPDIPAIPDIPTIPKLHTGGVITRNGVVPFAGFQRGGVVGQSALRRRPGPRDTVPALLEPGELVIPRGVNLADEAAGQGQDAMAALQREFDAGYRQAGEQTTRFVAEFGAGLDGAVRDSRTKAGQIRADTVTAFTRATSETTRQTGQLTRTVGAAYRQTAGEASKLTGGLTAAWRTMGTETGRVTDRLRAASVADFTAMSGRTVTMATQQRERVTGQFRDMQHAASRSTGRLRDITGADLAGAQQVAAAQAGRLRQGTTRALDSTREQVGRATGRIRATTATDFEGAQQAATTQTGELRDNTSRNMQQARSRFAAVSDGTRTDVVGNFDRLSTGVGAGLSRIEGALNTALSALGVKKVSFTAKQPERKQAGGRLVGGQGSGDKVPALLEPGEVVWNREAVRNWFGGPDRADEVNKRFPRFQAGGIVPVPGFPGERASSKVTAAITSFARKYRMLLTDAYGPGHASPEHTQFGTAADFVPAGGGSWQLVTQAAHDAVRQGFTPVGYDGTGGTMNWPNHGPGNHVHIVFLTAAEALSGKTAGGPGGVGDTLLPKITLNGPDGAMTQLGQATVTKVREAGQQYLDKQQPLADFELGAAPGSISEAQFAKVAMQALTLTGKFPATPGNVRLLLGRAKQESGLNPAAINNWDINAKRGDPSRGLMQTIGSTFAAYHQPGTSNNIYDPLANIAAAINYMAARYGRVVGPSSGGYRHGGIVQRLAAGGIVAQIDAAGGLAQYNRRQRLAELRKNPRKNAEAIRRLETEIAYYEGQARQQEGQRTADARTRAAADLNRFKGRAAEDAEDALELARPAHNEAQKAIDAVNWVKQHAPAKAAQIRNTAKQIGSLATAAHDAAQKAIDDALAARTAGRDATRPKIAEAAANAAKAAEEAARTAKTNAHSALTRAVGTSGTTGVKRDAQDALASIQKGIDDRSKTRAQTGLSNLKTRITNTKTRNKKLLDASAKRARAKAVRKPLANIKNFGQLPAAISGAISRQTNWAETYGDWADRAERLNQDPSQDGVNELEPLLEQLEQLENDPRLKALRKDPKKNAAELAQRDSAIAQLRADITGRDWNTVAANAQAEYTRRWQAGLERVGGGTQKDWLRKRLTSLFRLRNSYVRARDWLAARRELIAERIKTWQKKAESLKKKMDRWHDRRIKAERQIDNLNAKLLRWREQLQTVTAKKKQTKQTRDRAQKLRDLIGPAEGKRQSTQARLREILETSGRLKGQRDAIVGKDGIIPGLRTESQAAKAKRGEMTDALNGVQGRGGPWERLNKLPGLGVLGGDILDVQLALRDIVPPKWDGSPPNLGDDGAGISDDTTSDDTTPAESPEDTERARLLEQLLREANMRTAVAERQFAVLKDFPPYLGSFARGLDRVPGQKGQPWLATVHGGETITPAGKSEPIVVQIIVEDGAVDTSKIRAIAAGEAQVVSRRQALAGGRVLPGAGGGVR